jgi:hypothetical protein
MIGCLHLQVNRPALNLAVSGKRSHREVNAIIVQPTFDRMAAKQYLSFNEVHAQIGYHMFTGTALANHNWAAHGVFSADPGKIGRENGR